MKRFLSILLENESGSLSRVIGLFSQRGYNIESLNVAPTEDPSISKMTVQTIGNKKIIAQIEKQLKKNINVLNVYEIKKKHIQKEIILIKINIEKEEKKILEIIEKFQGKIILKKNLYNIIQLSETNENIDKFLNLIKKKTNILELTRSGIISITKLE
ncbi:Acetolactate synthase isozyme 3 small subunit [Buchnera aphidicola (Tetraneura ulmi)]|uniref:acetolactate synthase small subunit n=1 Tax=Buchnera aphidicola TaxID=9 RepID=UPI003464490C